MSEDDTDRLQYLTRGELREEIAYAVGGDPTRYGAGSDRGLKKADVKRIATHLQPENSEVVLDAMDLGNLYEVVCRWAGGKYQPNAGKPWGVNRPNLKEIHRAVGGEDPRDNLVAATDGGIDRSRPSVYKSSLEGCIYAECPTCTNTMRLGELWADLILNEGKDVPPCPECDDGSGDSWTDEADVIADGHELWACMGEPLDLDEDRPEMVL